MNDIAESDMANMECKALDKYRTIAHTALIYFKARRDDSGIQCLYSLREAFRILEFSMSPEEITAIISTMDSIEPILRAISINSQSKVDSRFVYYQTNKTGKNETPEAVLDTLFSNFYFYRQRAGLGVKTKQVEGL